MQLATHLIQRLLFERRLGNVNLNANFAWQIRAAEKRDGEDYVAQNGSAAPRLTTRFWGFSANVILAM